ncbi:hypothetical protein ACSFB8_04780 [Enterococcus faecalis]
MMRKSMKTEEWKNQRLHQFFAKLNGELPQITEDQQVEACCLSQYEQFVAITFSANILLKGVDYANRIYNHIVKVECTRLSKEIVKQPMNPAMKEKMLLNIQKKKKELLIHSPLGTVGESIALFYQTTGGMKEKYAPTRKAVKRIFLDLHHEEKKKYFRYLIDRWHMYRLLRQQKRQYRKWLLKSYIWH